MNTKISIINAMLSMAGMSYSDGLDLDHPLYSAAESIYETKLKELLTANDGHGWWWNTDTITLTPDVHGRIYVPDSVLHLDVIEPVEHCGTVRRGELLYDRSRESYTFPQEVAIKARAAVMMDVDDTPVPFREALRYACKAMFAAGPIQEAVAEQRETQKLQAALYALQQDNTAQSRPNLINGQAGSFARSIAWRYWR